jgi:phage-related protein
MDWRVSNLSTLPWREKTVEEVSARHESGELRLGDGWDERRRTWVDCWRAHAGYKVTKTAEQK